MIGAEILAQIGLPPTWAPTAITWALVKLAPTHPAGGDTVHLLIIDGAAGRLAFAFTPDELAALAVKIMEQMSGLVVADTLPHERNGRTS